MFLINNNSNWFVRWRWLCVKGAQPGPGGCPWRAFAGGTAASPAWPPYGLSPLGVRRSSPPAPWSACGICPCRSDSGRSGAAHRPFRETPVAVKRTGKLQPVLYRNRSMCLNWVFISQTTFYGCLRQLCTDTCFLSSFNWKNVLVFFCVCWKDPVA